MTNDNAVETVEDAVCEILDETCVDDEAIVDELSQDNALPLTKEQTKCMLEAAIFAAGEPMPLTRLMALFDAANAPSKDDVKAALDELMADYEERGVELSHVATGYRFQARAEYAGYLQKLWEKKPPRFSRAMLETLALIVYRQPITRGEIEEVRGVSTSSQIMRNLMERDWIKISAYKDVPGKPALYSTTKDFLDYFDFKSLSQLPDLREIIDLDQKEKELNEQLVLNMSLQEKVGAADDSAQITPDDMIAGEDSEDVAVVDSAEAQADEAVADAVVDSAEAQADEAVADAVVDSVEAQADEGVADAVVDSVEAQADEDVADAVVMDGAEAQADEPH